MAIGIVKAQQARQDIVPDQTKIMSKPEILNYLRGHPDLAGDPYAQKLIETLHDIKPNDTKLKEPVQNISNITNHDTYINFMNNVIKLSKSINKFNGTLKKIWEKDVSIHNSLSLLGKANELIKLQHADINKRLVMDEDSKVTLNTMKEQYDKALKAFEDMKPLVEDCFKEIHSLSL